MEKIKVDSKEYNEALEQYLQEGINWDATAVNVIRCNRGNVEQLAADSFWEGWRKAVELNSQWIKVTDRLPEDEEQLVLVIDSLRRCYVADYEPLHGRWERLDGFYVDVTHWMPLPEPPKE